ncbi:uncharacterized protein LOC127751142 [Frankliniella occidentalis]|uniref:Uncharacterized protein LOC127751142 n=1 Tax=Frankliniella occidentalis TaxID=133901 RepID=A0A9C6X6V2_FRAOC|nr:uncharacterized protein LOC127751142 [Frankliniella occidentalis]
MRSVEINQKVSVAGRAYNLCSAIVHYGGTPSAGHYKAYGQCPDKSWALFNDDEVSLDRKCDLSLEEVKSQCCILMYEKDEQDGASHISPLQSVLQPGVASLISKQPVSGAKC